MPLALLALLYNRRHDISSRLTRAGGKSLSGLSFFFSSFSVDKWWWAVVDMYRRLALSSLLLFFPPTQQLLIAFCIGATAIVTAREISPFYGGGEGGISKPEQSKLVSRPRTRCPSHYVPSRTHTQTRSKT